MTKARAASRTLSAAASKFLLGGIAFYRLAVSPWLPARCRFAPSCSAYAAEAIALHGPLKGSRLALARVARCHPWHAGGSDPVPVLPPAVYDAAPDSRTAAPETTVRRRA